jgi:phage protein D
MPESRAMTLAILSALPEEQHGLAALLEDTQVVARAGRRFVRGRGVTLGTPSLRVGSRLDLVDLGPWFRGIYLVTAVTHAFDQVNGYRTHFEAQRAQIGGAP